MPARLILAVDLPSGGAYILSRVVEEEHVMGSCAALLLVGNLQELLYQSARWHR